MASPFEIEQAVHELLDQPYDPATFLIELGQAFGAAESWAKRVKDGSGAKSTVAEGGVLWVKKFHGLTCAPGTLDARFSELLDTSSSKRKLAFRFAIATDGQGFKALDTLSGETLNCDLDDLRREFWFLKALAGYDDYVLPKESEVDMQASAMLRRLYDTLIRVNPDWTTAQRQHDLNQFMTRVIFCLFAEDVGIFEDNLFSRTVQTLSDDLAQGLDDILAAVFAVMNVPEGERGAIPAWQAAFPYVNGGLFGSIESAETVAIPTFNRAARRYLLDAGEQDWGVIRHGTRRAAHWPATGVGLRQRARNRARTVLHSQGRDGLRGGIHPDRSRWRRAAERAAAGCVREWIAEPHAGAVPVGGAV